MATVDPKKLDEVISAARIGARSARKLRAANQPVPPQAPRGHGAPVAVKDSPPAR